MYHIHAPDRAALARVAEGIPEGVVVPCDESGIPEHHHKSSWRWAWPWTKDEGAIRLPEGVDYVFEFGASKVSWSKVGVVTDASTRTRRRTGSWWNG